LNFRFPDVAADEVLQYDPSLGKVETTHKYIEEGEFTVLAYGFDERHYNEARLPVFIYGIPCTVPLVTT